MTDELLIVRNPDDGSIVGEAPVTPLEGLEHLLEKGRRATREAPPPAHERSRILRAVSDRLAANAESRAQLIAREGIKTIREARAEVRRAVETLRLSAEEAKRNGGSVLPFDQVPSGEGRIGWWANRPAGLVVAITPYNDPLNLVAHKLGPAFAAGCPIILKPHPQTPLSALHLVEDFHECGASEHRVQLVIGGAEAGAVLVSDPRPRIVSFTGGPHVGDVIARQAGIKQLILELGGVGLVAVAADADLELAANSIQSGAFWAAGQNCVRAQRIVADASVADELIERLIAKTRELRLGRKLDETTDMGPLVDSGLAASLMRNVDEMRSAGASLLAGGDVERNRMTPTWVTGLSPGHPLFGRELFGPVSTIERVSGVEQLLDQMRSASDAIHAAIFTRSISVATAAFQQCNAAALLVNDSTDFRIDAMPFGGIGSAGLGREGVADAMNAMSEKRLIIVTETAVST